MKLLETILTPPSIFEKERRHVYISEISQDDFVQLHYILRTFFIPPKRRNCKAEVYVNQQPCIFETEKELEHFISGFLVAMNLNDPSFIEKAKRYASFRGIPSLIGIEEGVLDPTNQKGFSSED